MSVIKASDLIAIKSGKGLDEVGRFDKPQLILGDKSYTPTKEEFAMFIAQSAALRSACMSRQVGAAITTTEGDIIATGRNDVPKCGGGIYTYEDYQQNKDGRCMYAGNNTCASDKHKKDLVESIKSAILPELEAIKDLPPNIVDNISDKIASHPQLKGLVEYTRAVHAEMDAITTAAKLGRTLLKGTEMYVTTFPCHHCARHIVASGILKVHYIEPYEKSLATRLHDDSIITEVDETTNRSDRVAIVPFEGVAPRKYLFLFAAKNRKADGRKTDFNPKQAKPTCDKQLDTHFEYERVVINHLHESFPAEPKGNDDSKEAS